MTRPITPNHKSCLGRCPLLFVAHPITARLLPQEETGGRHLSDSNSGHPINTAYYCAETERVEWRGYPFSAWFGSPSQEVPALLTSKSLVIITSSYSGPSPLPRPITFHQAGSRMPDKRRGGILRHTQLRGEKDMLLFFVVRIAGGPI